FLLLPLGLIAKPFGAPGLLFVLAVSVGAAYFWATRILRLLGVGERAAVVASGVLLISPLSVAFYQEWAFGFHIEVLAPALCLVLFFFLLQQRMIPSIVAAGSLSSPGALFIFVASNLAHWLGSGIVRQWLWVMIVGSFATILLRSYYLVFGVLTTVVPWLINRNDLLWAPRFFSTEALLWCVTLVGFASIAHAVPSCGKGARIAVLAAAIAVVAFSAWAQLALVPPAYSAYLLRSGSFYSLAERQQADAVFARYRREGKPDEPVVASTMLFRYAHDRNLFWLNRLHDRPAPIWILGDSADFYAPLRISSDTINP